MLAQGSAIYIIKAVKVVLTASDFSASGAVRTT
jgi:hypothetical protein